MKETTLIDINGYLTSVLRAFKHHSRCAAEHWLACITCKLKSLPASPRKTGPHSEAMTCFVSSGSARRRVKGVTLIEMSIVLAVMAVILAAVSTGGNLIQIASGQRIFTEHLVGWKNAYMTYLSVTKIPPGDSASSPTYFVNGAFGSLLCNAPNDPKLTNAMLAKSVSLPAGRGVGMEDLYVYQDSNSIPHELKVCFSTVDWSIPGTTSGSYVVAPRNVMVIRGVTTELAQQFDSLMDGKLDARFGNLRRSTLAASLSSAGVSWPAVKTNSSDDDVQELTLYVLMN